MKVYKLILETDSDGFYTPLDVEKVNVSTLDRDTLLKLQKVGWVSGNAEAYDYINYNLDKAKEYDYEDDYNFITQWKKKQKIKNYIKLI